MKRPNVMRALRRLVLFACCCSVVLPSGASGAQRFVAPVGQSFGSCEQSAPCTPEYAVNSAAQPGDDVIIAPGNYNVPAPLVARRSITVRGAAGRPRPHLFNDGSGSTTVPGDSATIEYSGVTLVVTDAATARHLGVHQSGGNATSLWVETTVAEDVVAVATGGSSYAARLVAGGDQFPGDVLFRDSVAHAQGTDGTALDASGFDVRLRNVTALASGSGGSALKVYGTGFCAQVYCPGPSPARVSATNVLLRGDYTDASISTNGYSGTFAELRIGYSNYRPGAVLVSSQSSVVNEGGNQSGEPLLSKPAAGDYRQQASSPTINAGISDAFTGSSDLDGDSRTTGGSPDIGADEFVASTQNGLPAQGAGAGSTASTVPTSSARDQSGPVLLLPRSNRRLAVSRRGVFRFRVGPVVENTTGLAAFKTAGRVALASGAQASVRKVLSLGTKSFKAKRGQTAILRVKLTKRSFRALKRLKRLRVRARVTLRDAAKNATVKTLVFTLKAPR